MSLIPMHLLKILLYHAAHKKYIFKLLLQQLQLYDKLVHKNPSVTLDIFTYTARFFVTFIITFIHLQFFICLIL